MNNFGFVLAAYTIIWGLLAIYLGSITVKVSRLRKEYNHLKEYLADKQ